MIQMTVEQKLDIVLKHLKLRFELNAVIENKNNAVRKQDFEAAVKYREMETALSEEYNKAGQAMCELLNQGETDERNATQQKSNQG